MGAQCMRVRVLANRGQARDVQFSEWHFMGNDGSFIEPIEVTAAGTSLARCSSFPPLPPAYRPVPLLLLR